MLGWPVGALRARGELVLVGLVALTFAPMLFEPPHEELSDEEIAAVLRQSMKAQPPAIRPTDTSPATRATTIPRSLNRRMQHPVALPSVADPRVVGAGR